MKLVLLDALHARPANLLVRLATQYRATVELCKDGRRADGKSILDVLALGAAKGETIELVAAGEDEEAALTALTALIERNFDADLVPETGTLAASGLAVGRAVLVPASASEDSAPALAMGPQGAADARARLEAAFAEVLRDLERTVHSLPAAEAALFEPEIAIVQALERSVLARVAGGERADDALRAGTSNAQDSHELLIDARDRLLDAYAAHGASRLTRLLAQTPDGDLILVTQEITPSLVALAPERVVGIVAASDDAGDTSHAAILARGRGFPLVFVPLHVAQAVSEGDTLVVDATASVPRLWLTPSEGRIAEARAARAEHLRTLAGEGARLEAPLSQFLRHDGMPLAVRVNIGSIHDSVPRAAEGIGLIRTELLFAARGRAPSADDQLATLLLLVGKVTRGPIVARLFDAGGDKPLSWLRPPDHEPGARGIDLLRRHPPILRGQIGMIGRAAERADVRLLIPLVRGAEDVAAVRCLAPPSLLIGAMIETPEAVALTAEIAAAADFICIGTNDLSAFARGQDRVTAMASPADPQVLSMVDEVVKAAHRCGRAVTVCGEIAGDPSSAIILAGLDVDAISVAPSRFAAVKDALVSTSQQAGEDAARRAIGEKRKG